MANARPHQAVGQARTRAPVTLRPNYGAPVGKPSRTSICAVSCKETATTPARGQREASEQRPLLGAVAATATAITLLLIGAPHADAVSGGGGISTPLSGQDFSGQDLRKRAYTKAVLRKTNFAGANLTGVSFFSSLAEGANFRGANMALADLESGNFEGADFTNAVLAGAFVNNAQLQGATITGTDWSDVVLRKDMQKYLCSIADGTNPVTGVDTRESLVCP